MRHRDSFSNLIARERLKQMVESEAFDCSPEVLDQIKKEISLVIGKYFDLTPDTYEIKVLLKQMKKRA